MSRSIFRSTSIGVFAIGALIGGVAFMTGASGIVGSPTAAAVPSQEEPEPYVICTRGTDDEGKDTIDHAVAAPWAPGAVALEPGDPLPEPDDDPDNVIEPPITNGMIVEGRGAGEGTTYLITIDSTCGLADDPPSAADPVPPTSYLICTQGTDDEGKDTIDHPIIAPWAPGAVALEPGDPLPEPDSDPDNVIEPPITNGMTVEGRGAGEGTTYLITIDSTCGLADDPPSAADPVPPTSYLICTQGTDDEGKDTIDHPIIAPWAPGAVALEPGDPLPEPDSDPDNVIEPPITNGMTVEGRGAGEGTTYVITIDSTCGLADAAPVTTSPTTTTQPGNTLQPSFTG
jgi:hypothetical protein